METLTSWISADFNQSQQENPSNSQQYSTYMGQAFESHILASWISADFNRSQQENPSNLPYAQQYSTHMGQPFDFNQSQHCIPAYYDKLTTSMSSSGVQQQQKEVSQHYSLPDKQFPDVPLVPSNDISPKTIGRHSNVEQQKGRPFKCDCGKTFRKNQDLSRHKKIHLPVTIVKCGACSRKYTRQDSLVRHIRKRKCKNTAAENVSKVYNENIRRNWKLISFEEGELKILYE